MEREVSRFTLLSSLSVLAEKAFSVTDSFLFFVFFFLKIITNICEPNYK